jgi:hypothetical protein
MNNPLSYSSIKIDLYSKESVHLKSASGFVVEARSRYYLITNWHVLSGREIPASGPQERAIEPYLLKTSLHIHGGAGEKSGPISIGVWKRITIQLYDNNDAPTWIERPVNKPYHPIVDVVALPLQLDLTLRLFSGKIPGININKGSWAETTDYWTKISAIPASAIDTDVEYAPPDRVHVIGYPRGWAPEGTERSSSAFWRTSSIASEIHEPGMKMANTFFIDPCPPQGMTGSPVVGMKNDRIKLLGVYSDRSTEGFGANAGFVWEAFVVKELISAP